MVVLKYTFSAVFFGIIFVVWSIYFVLVITAARVSINFAVFESVYFLHQRVFAEDLNHQLVHQLSLLLSQPSLIEDHRHLYVKIIASKRASMAPAASSLAPASPPLELVLRSAKASGLAPGITMHRWTTSGPHEVTSEQLRQEQRGDLLYVHLFKEELASLNPFSPSTGTDIEIDSYQLPSEFRGSLREPWMHLSFFQDHQDCIHQSCWLLSEGRIYTRHLNESYIIGFRPSVTDRFHQLLEHHAITVFNRHQVSRSYQLMNHKKWVPSDVEKQSLQCIKVIGDITQAFDAYQWEASWVWDYHVPIKIEGIIEEMHRHQLFQGVRETLGHAGLMLLGSESHLAPDIKVAIVDCCMRNQVSLVTPRNITGARYRGHHGHRSYILEQLEDIVANYPSNDEHRPCVPLYHLEAGHPMLEEPDGTGPIIEIPLSQIRPIIDLDINNGDAEMTS